MRYFIAISYDGARFHGWQVQPNALSVQQVLEESLGKIMRRPTPVTGAGRTDTGVNARLMYAHFDADGDIMVGRERFLRSLNSLVGPDIAVSDVIAVGDEAHARFDADSRTYRYFVHHSKDPFLRRYSLLSAPLDYALMNRTAEKLLEMNDFTSFAKLHSDAKTNICRVSEARWIDLGDGRHAFEITADRFLRNMVRAVVGTLVEVGRGKLTPEEFVAVAERRDRCAAGTSMPAHALFLWNVTYPYIKVKN